MLLELGWLQCFLFVQSCRHPRDIGFLYGNFKAFQHAHACLRIRGTKLNGFGNGTAVLRLFCGSSQVALAGASMPCNSLPGLKRTALPGGMLTSSPVRGLRPMPVLRGLTLKTPKRRSSMR